MSLLEPVFSMPCTSCFALEGEDCKPWCPSLTPKKHTNKGKGDKR